MWIYYTYYCRYPPDKSHTTANSKLTKSQYGNETRVGQNGLPDKSPSALEDQLDVPLVRQHGFGGSPDHHHHGLGTVLCSSTVCSGVIGFQVGPKGLLLTRDASHAQQVFPQKGRCEIDGQRDDAAIQLGKERRKSAPSTRRWRRRTKPVNELAILLVIILLLVVVQ